METVPLAHRLAERFHQRVVHLGHKTALLADQMVMAGTAKKLEMAHAAAEVGFANQADVAEEFQRAVDRRSVERGYERLDPRINLVRGEVLTGLGEGGQNQQTLSSHA